jgi:hypothetical protein
MKRLVLILVAVAVLGAIRFAHHTPDTLYYTEMVEHFRGTLPLAELDAPWAYRPAVPWIAHWLPLEADTALATVNLAAFFLACVLAARFFRRILSPAAADFAPLLMVVSFPTVNYSSAALTEGAGFLVMVLAIDFIRRRNYLVLTVCLALGVLVRETVLIAVLAAFLFELTGAQRLRAILPALCALPAFAVIFMARAYPPEPGYVWTPALWRVADNLQQPVAYATVLLTLAPLLLLWGYGVWKGKAVHADSINPEDRRLLRAWLIACIALFTYSLAAAFMSGRFVWPAYLALCPLVAERLAHVPLLGRMLQGANGNDIGLSRER